MESGNCRPERAVDGMKIIIGFSHILATILVLPFMILGFATRLTVQSFKVGYNDIADKFFQSGQSGKITVRVKKP